MKGAAVALVLADRYISCQCFKSIAILLNDGNCQLSGFAQIQVPNNSGLALVRACSNHTVVAVFER